MGLPQNRLEFNTKTKQNDFNLQKLRVKDVLTPTPKTPVWTSARTAAGSGASRRKQRLSGLSDSGQSVGPVVSQWEGLNPCRVPLCAVCMISPNSGGLLRAGSHKRDSSPQEFHFLVKQRLTQQICFLAAGKIIQSLIFK